MDRIGKKRALYVYNLVPRHSVPLRHRLSLDMCAAATAGSRRKQTTTMIERLNRRNRSEDCIQRAIGATSS